MTALKAAAYFYDVLEKRAKDSAPAEARPRVGYFCNVVPDEMILACGALPERLCCMDAACARLGEQSLGADACPMVKSIVGAYENSPMGGYKLIVVPGTCDSKAQMFQHLKTTASMYFLDLPRENDYLKNCELWVERFESFYRHLKKLLKVNPSRDDLLAQCRAANERTAAFRRLEELRAIHPQAIGVRDYFAAATASFSVLPGEWAQQANLLLREAESAERVPEAGKGRKKILLAGAPVIHPYFKIIDILDRAGLDTACDTLCSAHGKLFDPVVIDEETEEGIVRALALKHVSASLCPGFLSFNKLAEHIIDRVRTLRLDGVVFHSLRLCQLFDGQARLLRQSLKDNEIPFLVIKSDLNGEDSGQISTRVEAFREMLE